jgi:hypothetical protein
MCKYKYVASAVETLFKTENILAVWRKVISLCGTYLQTHSQERKKSVE